MGYFCTKGSSIRFDSGILMGNFVWLLKHNNNDIVHVPNNKL